MVVFNDASGPDQLAHMPLRIVEIEDSIANDNAAPPESGTLCPRLLALYAMAAPVLQQKNMISIWSKAITQVEGIFPGDATVPALSVDMACGGAQAGVGVTSFAVSETDEFGKVRATPLHVVWNRKANRILVVGDGPLTADLKTNFKNMKITYVDRSDKQAVASARTGINHVLQGIADKDKTESLLRHAFLSRVAQPESEEAAAREKESTLAQLLVSQAVNVDRPCYIKNDPVDQEPAPRAA
jgi:hypothetical protein